jgi:hypothetical protein
VREPIPPVFSSIFICTPRVRQGWGQSISTPGIIRVWDIQEGAVISDISIEGFCELVLPGILGTLTFITKRGYSTYDGDKQQGYGNLQLPNHQLGTQWAHKGSLRFTTSLKTGGGFIDVWELHYSSGPLLLVDSFRVPPQGGKISFSSVSSHASFVSEAEIVILDIRDSKVLLQTKATQLLYTPPGQFSPNGRFFACGTSLEDIFIWENTITGYIPWNTLRPQLPSKGFSFSPTAISILSWGPGGVQLLHPTNHVSPLPSDKIESHHQGSNHLVASPTDRMHVATAQQEGIVVSRRAIADPG